MLLATQGFQEKRVLHRRSHYSYIFFFHFPEHVTPQTIFLAEVSKYLPTLRPNLLHHSFPLSYFAAMKLSSRSFSSSQALTAGSVLCLQMSTFIQLLLPPHPSVRGLSWLHSYSASHLFSSCNPDSVFQLIRSPTVSFALASTFLSLIF